MGFCTRQCYLWKETRNRQIGSGSRSRCQRRVRVYQCASNCCRSRKCGDRSLPPPERSEDQCEVRVESHPAYGGREGGPYGSRQTAPGARRRLATEGGGK